jgi:hypothetical protein
MSISSSGKGAAAPRKGLLASRIEERLAMLQKQGKSLEEL